MLIIIISLAAIEVADVTAGITATAMFFCNVTGASGADNVGYRWAPSRNGIIIPENTFPNVIYGNRVIGLTEPTLSIVNLNGLEQDFDYTCNVSIGGRDMQIGSATGALISPGMYSGLWFALYNYKNLHISDTLSLSLSLFLSLVFFCSLSLSLSLSLSVGPMIATGPVSQVLQAGERLALSCIGVNNADATMPLRINWFFTSFDSQFPQRLYNNTDPRVNETRMADNITVMSFFVIDPVAATDAGVYGCQVSNRDGIPPIEQNATVNVLCKCCTSRVATV
jgi:hypothetical protein